MAQVNGMWKVIATVGGFVIIALGAAVAYGILSEKVCGMEPNVEKNTEHRIKFEEKVNTMDRKIDQILEEVKR